MTLPTDAQQLAKWIGELKWKSVDKDNMEFEVRTTCYVRDALLKWATLTAAAVTPTDARTEAAWKAMRELAETWDEDVWDWKALAKAALTAAEVEGRPPGNITDRMLAECLDREKATIERCAQIVMECRSDASVDERRQIAEAILKEIKVAP